MPRVARRRPARKPRRVLRKKRMGLKKTMPRASTTNYATVTEGFEQQLTLDATGQYSFNFTTSLSAFSRATEVAHSYKYYRCKSIELTFVPYANISSVGGPLAARLPQLYFQIDRVANQYIAPSEAEMIERGVTPRLFKKKMVFKWKPNLLQNVQMETNQPTDGGGQPLGIDVINAINSVPLFNKWLPTQQSYGFSPAPPRQQIANQVVQPSANPWALRYYGAAFVISQEDGNEAMAIGDLITRVIWEFKGPRAVKTVAPAPQSTVAITESMTTNGRVANTQPSNYTSLP